MKKIAIILSAFFVLTAFTTTVSTWQNDDPHSQLGFTVKHLGIADVSGTFNDFDVTVTSSKPDFSDAVFELTANVASLDTRVEARDNHLKSADFFNAEKFPAMTFKSKDVRFNGDVPAAADGELTLLGVTRPLTLSISKVVCAQHPFFKKEDCGAEITGILKRSDFGMNKYIPAVGDEVTLRIQVESLKDQADAVR